MPDSDDKDALISEAVLGDDVTRLETVLGTGLNDADELGAWLSLASAKGNLRAMRALLDHGANVNCQMEGGETPFSHTCASNQLGAAKLLFEAGADVNSPLESGLTPLDCAVCWSSPEFRKWLREVGGQRNGTFDEWQWPTPEAG